MGGGALHGLSVSGFWDTLAANVVVAPITPSEALSQLIQVKVRCAAVTLAQSARPRVVHLLRKLVTVGAARALNTHREGAGNDVAGVIATAGHHGELLTTAAARLGVSPVRAFVVRGGQELDQVLL